MEIKIMKRDINLFEIYFLMLLIFFGCSTPTEKRCDNNLPPYNIDSSSSIIMFSDTNDVRIYPDPAIITGVAFKSDTLILYVQYSGGCREHYFKLFGYKGFMKSNPMQANIYLSHDSQNDPCEAWLSDTLKFDLTPLKNYYIYLYCERDPILLRIHEPGQKEPLLPLVRYEF